MLRRPFPCQQLDVRLWDGDARSHLTLLLLISSKLLLQVHETLIQLSDLVCQEITLAPWRQRPQCDLFSSQRTNGYTWVLSWSRRRRKKKRVDPPAIMHRVLCNAHAVHARFRVRLSLREVEPSEPVGHTQDKPWLLHVSQIYRNIRSLVYHKRT